MPATRADMIRRIARRLGYAGVEHDAGGETASLIGEVYDDVHAELVERGKATWDFGAVPDGYVRAVARYAANEAEQEMDRSRDLNAYEQERRMAWKDICRVVERLPAQPAPNDPANPDYGRVTSGSLRHI